MGNNYFKDRDIKSEKELNNLVYNDLPLFCDEFFVGINGRTTSLTRLNYARDLRTFFDYCVKQVPYFFRKDIKPQDISLKDLEVITTTDIERYLVHLNTTNSNTTKARKISAVRCLFKYFFKKDKISRDVASNVATPKIKEKEIIRLEVDEVAKILDNVESGEGLSKKQAAYHDRTKIRDTAIITLFLGCGLRISELVGLNVEDIDFNLNALKVQRKGGSKVILYFNDEVQRVLVEYINNGRSKMTKADGTLIEIQSSDSNALFLSSKGTRMNVRTIENLVKKYAKTVNPLKKITPHKLRSTFGTNLYQETKDIYIVADVLGHKDINTTKKHYAAIDDMTRREAAKAVKLREDE